MREPAQLQRVTASPEAVEAISRVRAEHGTLMFFQSGGCCDGSLPMCFEEGELLLGDGDALLGDLDGCAFYIDGQQDAAWGYPELVLDVAPGSPEGFSLSAGGGQHFITRSSVCARPSAEAEEAPPIPPIHAAGGAARLGREGESRE